jgi:hydroxyacylglutathione hydrolase
MLSVEQIPVGALGTNCYLVWDEGTKKGILVDPGDNATRIMNRVREHELTITSIIATHCHFDHIGAVAPLLEELKVPFMMHKDDLSWVEESENAAARWGFTIRKPKDPDRFLEDGDIIDVGGEKLTVLHTPGHSSGGMSLLYQGGAPNIVIVGDTLFQGSIGRTDFRQGSFELLERSIREKLYSLPDDTIVFTGHGSSTTIGQEKRSNPFVRP